MAYASLPQVMAFTPARGTYTPTSIPNASAVIQFLEEEKAVLDSILRKAGYALPVATGATSTLELLEGINALGAALRVEQVAQVSDRKDEYERMYENAKKMLAASRLDAARDENLALPREPAVPTPFFTRDMVL